MVLDTCAQEADLCLGKTDVYFLKLHHYHHHHILISTILSLVAQMVKNLPAVQETRVRSLGQEDALGKGMATHSSMVQAYSYLFT